MSSQRLWRGFVRYLFLLEAGAVSVSGDVFGSLSFYDGYSAFLSEILMAYHSPNFGLWLYTFAGNALRELELIWGSELQIL